MIPAFALLLAAAAVAADSKGPVIQHTALDEATRYRALTVEAQISDESGVVAPHVYWRLAKSKARFVAIVMRSTGGGTYAASIAAESITGDVEYFVEAFDKLGNGPTRYGSQKKPMTVRVVAKATPAAPVAATIEAPPASADARAETAGASEADLDAAPPQAEPPQWALEDSDPPFRTGPAVTAGAGVLLLAVGAVLYLGAGSSIGTIDAKYAQGAGRSPEDYDATQEASGRGFLGSLLMLAGTGAAVGGAAWWFGAAPEGPPSLQLNLRF